MLYSCCIACCASRRKERLPQRRSATSDAQNAVLVQILQSAASTSTRICHPGCPECCSRAESAVGGANLNADLPPRLPRMLLLCRFCSRRRRPQRRSTTCGADNAMPMPPLHAIMLSGPPLPMASCRATLRSACQYRAYGFSVLKQKHESAIM